MANIKTILHRVNHDEKAESCVPDEGQDKIPEKQLNKVEVGNFSEKRILNNDSEDIQVLKKRNGGKD